MTKRALIQFTYRYIFPLLGLIFIKTISSTYKIKVMDLENSIKSCSSKNGIIYAALHQRFFHAITFFAKKRPIAAIISQSKDGELISRIVKALGWHPVRGSSSKGGTEALKKIITLVYSGYNVGHAVDGPQGPFGIVKPGVIKIAQVTRTGIVPVIMSCNKCWIFNSWDQFMVPKPFAKVIILFAKPHKVPHYMNEKEFEKERLYLEKKIAVLHKNMDSMININCL